MAGLGGAALPRRFGLPLDQGCTLPRARLPTYNRAGVSVGIVHIGVGNFHRAHEANVIDTLLREGYEDAKCWGICGVSVLSTDTDELMRDVMARQDGLYTLVTRPHNGPQEARVIGSIVQYLHAPDGEEAVLAVMIRPAVKIVSLTITEGGYSIDSKGDIDTSQPNAAFDLIIEALMRRHANGTALFAVQSCDNIEGNGDVAKRAILAFARERDPDLAALIKQEVAFPNSMVDRIAPKTTSEDITDVREQYGIDDKWPAVCESWFQWVLEDTYKTGRPHYDRAGVQFLDVAPFEKMKLRLLNASHQAFAYFGFLRGYKYAHEAADDNDIHAFVRAYMDNEATPTLDPVPDQDRDFAGYKNTLMQRFRNAATRDEIKRLCEFSSDRIPKFLVPVIHENLAEGRPVRCAAAVVASWARYAEGTDEHGQPIEVEDNLKSTLMPLAQQQRETGDVAPWLAQERLFGDLASQDSFVSAYKHALQMLWEQGAKDTVRELVAGR